MLKSLTLLVVQSSQMLLDNTGVLSVQHQCTILIAPERASSGRIFFFFIFLAEKEPITVSNTHSSQCNDRIWLPPETQIPQSAITFFFTDLIQDHVVIYFQVFKK